MSARDVAAVGGLAGGTIEPIAAPASIWRFVSEWSDDDPIGSAPPRPDWLLTRPTDDEGPAGVMRGGKVALLAAAGGTGKTALNCSLALSLATGVPWVGTFDVPRPGPVALLLGEEDHDEVHRRLHYAARTLSLDPDEREAAARHILAVPLAGQACALVENDEAGNVREAPFLAELRDRLTGAGVEWRAVILDPLSRFAGLETEVSNAAATRFVQALETLSALPGRPAVIVAHHTNKAATREGKSDQTSARGASALVDGARWLATLTGVTGHAHAVIFEVQKSNYARRGAPVLLIRGRGGALRAATVEEWAEVYPEKEGRR